MPKVLRPRQEFPTPLFRMVACLGMAALGGAPGVVVAHTLGRAFVLVVAAFVGSFAATRATTGRRLTWAAFLAFLAMVAVSAIVIMVAVVTYPWE
jgi:hypothetical protein